MEEYVRIIHLTDLHFGEARDDGQHRKMLPKFYQKLREIRGGDNVKFHVAITGDFLNRYDDYVTKENKSHEDDFVSLINNIVEQADVPTENFIFCLGNHDKSKKKYDALLQGMRGGKNKNVTYYEHINGLKKADRLKINKTELDDKIIDEIITNQSIFFDPYKALGDKCKLPKINLNDTSPLLGIKIIDKIRYIALNSSWFCAESIPTLDKKGNPVKIKYNEKDTPEQHITLIQDNGNLSLGKKITQQMFKFADTDEGGKNLFTVGLIHHNVRSLGLDNHHELEGNDSLVQQVYKRCSLLLSGHEHGELVSDLSGLKCYTSCSGTFYSTEDSVNGNTFSTIDILFGTQQIKKTIYKYDDDEWKPVLIKAENEKGEKIRNTSVDFLEFPKIVMEQIRNHKITSNEYYLRLKSNIKLKRAYGDLSHFKSAKQFLEDDIEITAPTFIVDFESLEKSSTLQAYVERHNAVRAQVFKKIYQNKMESKIFWKEPFNLT